ncbi:MAG: hypothetical protein HS116_02755 [Planctomycetes bacterium]|nr:hypothetical protein [Planctomycetota bacterium]
MRVWTKCGLLLALLISANLFAAGAEKRDLAAGGHYVLLLPEPYKPEKKHEVILALHGAGDTAENFTRFWTGFAKKRGSILAVPEASSKAGPGYTWNSDDIARIVATLEDVKKNFSVDPGRVLLTGHSAGCAIGFMTLEKEHAHFTCFGGTAHGLSPGTKPAVYEPASKTTAIYYSVGKQDPNHRIYASTVETLKAANVFLKHEEPDIGHTIVPAQIESMLQHFDAACDRGGAEKLTAAKRLLEGKQWGPAEQALQEASGGFGASAQEAAKLLETLKADLGAKLAEAKGQAGPDALEALHAFARDYRGTSFEALAKQEAQKIADDPKTAELARQRKQEGRNAEGQKALADAQALEKSGKLPLALEAYKRVAHEYADTPAKAPAEAAATRMAQDPSVNAAQSLAEAEKLFKRAENYLRNNAPDLAKQLYMQVAEKYPDTEFGKKAKTEAGKL